MNMMKYDAGTGELKNWLIQENAFDERYLGKCEAIFAQGNGYLGVRNALEEAYTGEVRNTFVTGTFNKASREEVKKLAKKEKDHASFQKLFTGAASVAGFILLLFTGAAFRSSNS